MYLLSKSFLDRMVHVQSFDDINCTCMFFVLQHFFKMASVPLLCVEISNLYKETDYHQPISIPIISAALAVVHTCCLKFRRQFIYQSNKTSLKLLNAENV